MKGEKHTGKPVPDEDKDLAEKTAEISKPAKRFKEKVVKPEAQEKRRFKEKDAKPVVREKRRFKEKDSKPDADEKKIKHISEYIEKPSVQAEVIQEETEEPPAKKASPRWQPVDPEKLAKAMYQVSIALLCVMVALGAWLGREHYTLSGLKSWYQLQFVGTGTGDGFPQPIKGHSIEIPNFFHVGQNVAALSDMALTVYNTSGKELYSVRHNFEKPAVSHVSDAYILYGIGAKTFMVQDGSRTKYTGETKGGILATATATGGVYAIASSSENYASVLDVYDKENEGIYRFPFSDHYITSVAINPAGTGAAVCSISSYGGVMQTKLTILDFSSEEKLYEHIIPENMLMDIFWEENNNIYVVGDNAFLYSSNEGKEFVEHGYQGEGLTAYTVENGIAMVSVSGHAYAGASTLWVFNGSANPVQIPCSQRVVSVSSYGGTVCALYGSNVGFFDKSTGKLQKELEGCHDLKAVALSSESTGYGLTISEIRAISTR